jgi:hypothetical protein
MEKGSNFVELHSQPGEYGSTSTIRVHIEEFEERLRFEPNADELYSAQDRPVSERGSSTARSGSGSHRSARRRAAAEDRGAFGRRRSERARGDLDEGRYGQIQEPTGEGQGRDPAGTVQEDRDRQQASGRLDDRAVAANPSDHRSDEGQHRSRSRIASTPSNSTPDSPKKRCRSAMASPRPWARSCGSCSAASTWMKNASPTTRRVVWTFRTSTSSMTGSAAPRTGIDCCRSHGRWLLSVFAAPTRSGKTAASSIMSSSTSS